MKIGPNCEIWSKLSNLVKIVKFHQNYVILSDLSNLVWFGMALYGLVEILKLREVQGGYVRVQGGYMWVLGGYLGG